MSEITLQEDTRMTKPVKGGGWGITRIVLKDTFRTAQ